MPGKRISRGWAWPKSARRAHFFVSGRSLCGTWTRGSGYLIADDGKDKILDCGVCTRKIRKLREKGEV